MTVCFIFMVYRKYKPQRHVCSKINLNNLFLKESVIILMIYAYKDIEKYKMDWLSSLFWIYTKHFSKEQALRGIGKLQWIGTLGRVMNKKNLKWFKLCGFFWTVFCGESEDINLIIFWNHWGVQILGWKFDRKYKGFSKFIKGNFVMSFDAYDIEICHKSFWLIV